MIKFLIQHASALEEKDDGLIDGDFQVEATVGTNAESIHLERSRVTQNIIKDFQGTDEPDDAMDPSPF